jgi:glutathione peroxidase
MKRLYDFEIRTIQGDILDWERFKNKKVLLFNTASECGYTHQLAGLEQLYRDYKEIDFEIIGIPCNDFGGQEPGTEEQILEFCQRNFEVSFTLTEKVSILGEEVHPLFKWLQLKSENGVGDFPVTWNFQKFGIDESGQLAQVFSTVMEPQHRDIVNWITQTQLF